MRYVFSIHISDQRGIHRLTYMLFFSTITRQSNLQVRSPKIKPRESHVRAPTEIPGPMASISSIADSPVPHSTVAMALEVDKLSEKVLELTTQNSELEATIMYHLKVMEETHSESKALHAILKLLKSAKPEAKLASLIPSISHALLSAGCTDLAALLTRQDIPRRQVPHTEHLDVLVNLILNGHDSS